MAFQWASTLFLCLASLVSGQNCTLGEVRLVDGGGSLSERNTGIVQICDSRFNWKRVCYFYLWNDNPYAHNLVCSQLGYENHGAVSVSVSTSQTSSSETAVSCMGIETTVADCSLSMEDCYWHARLTCRKVQISNCTNGEITLASGPSNREGRVEVCVDGHWGTVCGEGWGDTEAGLVCARLGFPREGAMITQYSQGTLQSIYNLTCLSHQSDPPDCTATPAPDSCDHSMDLGVRCLIYQEVRVSMRDESVTTEVLKRDSTNLMTSDKILGALTGLLTAALLVVTMGWIASCVCLVRKFKQRPSLLTTVG